MPHMATTLTATRNAQRLSQPRAVANWLLAVATLVFLMVVVGGITRLTESGLSITEWKPVSGAMPPLTDAAWQLAFDAYKKIPQYAAMNADMTLAQFKFIFSGNGCTACSGVSLALPLPCRSRGIGCAGLSRQGTRPGWCRC